jgi:hypothetical protein
MTLPLADICDLDCVISWRPLVLGTPATERYARGGNAIVRQVLGVWAREAGLLDLAGRSFDEGDLAALRSRLARLAEEVDYVDAVTLDLTTDEATSTLTIVAAELLIDGRVYPLEVPTADAAAAIAGSPTT